MPSFSLKMVKIDHMITFRISQMNEYKSQIAKMFFNAFSKSMCITG